MARIFITGSSDGLGLGAARTLMDEGHDVVLHARSAKRASEMPLPAKHFATVTGDLSSMAEVRDVARQVNRIGRMDAVIHNAGVYRMPTRGRTPEGHATTVAVNILAPYVLTSLIQRPNRLVYLSSGLHRGNRAPLEDLDWVERHWDAERAYGESKMLVGTLSAALARRWPNIFSNAVDPGWVPTKMGGAGASDDLEKGHLTQCWLAVSDSPDARVSGGYWHHHSQQSPDPAVVDEGYQEALLDRLVTITGVTLD